MILHSAYLEHGTDGVDSLPSGLDSPDTLVLVFSGLGCQAVQGTVAAVRAAFPASQIMGCSTAGEVVGPTVRDGGVAVTVARFERSPLTAAHVAVEDDGDSFAAGADLARRLASPSLAAVFLLSDGLQVNGSELLRGLDSVLGDGVVVTGGLAGDGDRFARTWVVADGRPTRGRIAALGVHGDAVRVGHGSRGGWDVFGPTRLVTRSERNVVYELDGRSALDLYQQYLGELSEGLPGSGLLFPLAVREQADDEEALVRTLLGVDHDQRSLRFAGDVPTGWNAQLMRANLDRLVDGAAGAASETADRAGGSEGGLGIAISCVGRRLVLKERVEEELEAVVAGLPAGTELAGFYSYGEISPVGSGRCGLHNQTMTLTTLSERPG